jgi:hypothetical protein
MALYSNTSAACVHKFLRSKHRDEFLAANPWMDLTTAAIVFFRRHTSHRMAYASFIDLKPVKGSEREAYEPYHAMYDVQRVKHWWQIPVSQAQCKGIRPETWNRYNSIIINSADQYLDIP